MPFYINLSIGRVAGKFFVNVEHWHRSCLIPDFANIFVILCSVTVFLKIFDLHNFRINKALNDFINIHGILI